MEAESPGQNISNEDHGLTEACCVPGSWNTREAETLKPCLGAPQHGAVVSALTAWRNGKACSVSALWLSTHSCAWTAGGAERESRSLWPRGRPLGTSQEWEWPLGPGVDRELPDSTTRPRGVQNRGWEGGGQSVPH